MTSKITPLKEGCGFSRGVFKASNPDPKSKKIYPKYKKLPYNPKLKKRARELRKAGNLSEVLFWMQVKKKKRESYLANLGLQIIHYQDIDIKKNLNNVIENLRQCCLELINERK